MSIGGLEVVRISSSGRKAYTDSSGNLYLDCSKCGVVTIEDGFSKAKHGFLGRKSHCKSCVCKRMRKYYQANKDSKIEYYQANKERIAEYRKSNLEHIREIQSLYRQTNREVRNAKNRSYQRTITEKKKVYNQRRRARKRSLPDTLTLEQMNQLGTTCVLTGQENVHLDHVIPLSIGHGGTVYENMIPLSAELNLSKNDSNVFEWAKHNHKRLGFTMNRFYKVMTDVASRNGMTLDEYRDYVYWCYENPTDTISTVTLTY